MSFRSNFYNLDRLGTCLVQLMMRLGNPWTKARMLLNELSTLGQKGEIKLMVWPLVWDVAAIWKDVPLSIFPD